MRQFLEEIINQHNYNLADMETRICKLYAMGKLSEEDMNYLLNLAAEQANDNLQIDIAAVLADLEQRVSALESKGVCVWVSGMITAKGQTVLFDVDKDGVLDYCRYDGGRATTASSPGKIEGWVKTTPEGTPTHRIQKDENNQIILIPIDNE